MFAFYVIYVVFLSYTLRVYSRANIRNGNGMAKFIFGEIFSIKILTIAT